MGRELADKFVGMYVNHWTLDYGEQGPRVNPPLSGAGLRTGLDPRQPELEFVG